MSLRSSAYTLRRILSSRAAIAAALSDARPLRIFAAPEVHLGEAVSWLCRAQDAVAGGGVSYGYDIHDGWMPPYPETTGYIIATFLKCAKQGTPSAGHAPEELADRALRMACWLTNIQLDSGALPGGTTAFEPTPTVFNTGQILEGWCEAHRFKADDRFLRAIVRAASWLSAVLDDDGCWRQHMSPLTLPTPATYNVRSAAALLKAGRLLDEPTWTTAALKNFNWALTQQAENGWFENNCLTDNSCPLTHTIGYTLEAILDAAEQTGDQRYMHAVRRASDRLIGAVRPDGFLSGRFNRDWQPTVRWCCLTGSSQLSLVWFRLTRTTGDAKYAEAAGRTIGYVRATQKVGAAESFPNPTDGTRGGIKGSHPVWGGYDPFRYPNWAAKFFVDALLAQSR